MSHKDAKLERRTTRRVLGQDLREMLGSIQDALAGQQDINKASQLDHEQHRIGTNAIQQYLEAERDRVNTNNARLSTEFHGFVDRSFWGRLKWILIGK